MVVQHNMTAMNANRMLGLTTSKQAKSTERLSSGYRINRAADDAAGLAISEKMRKCNKNHNALFSVWFLVHSLPNVFSVIFRHSPSAFFPRSFSSFVPLPAFLRPFHKHG